MSSPNLFAYKVIEDIATKAGGYDIPIKVYIPDKASGKISVMFFVHGGGWNGADNKEDRSKENRSNIQINIEL